MDSNAISIDESAEEGVSPRLIGELSALVVKAVKYANKREKFIADIAFELEKKLEICLEAAEPSLIVAQYLTEKMVALPNSNLKTTKAYELVSQFFRELTVPFNKALEAEFKDVIKNILEPSHDAVIVPNLWRQRTLTYDCYCLRKQEQIREQLCYRCGRKCHVNCFWQRQRTQKYFECPVCFLTKCFPHKPVNEIYFIGYLQHQIKQKIEYRMKFYIDMNRQNINNVEVRCVRLDKENRFEMTFPEQCCLKISNKKIKDIQPLPVTSPLKRRNEEEVIIDRYLLTYLNTLSLHQKNEYHQKHILRKDNHLIIIASTTLRPIPRLLVRSLQKQKITYEDSREMLKNYMKHPSNDCQIQKLNVALKCQYYSTRILIPARSIQCTTHYQPFDLSNFVQASLTAPNSVQSWRCPICKKRAYDLVVDEYILKLIQAHGSVMDITFNNEGQPIAIQKEVSFSDSQDPIEESINKYGSIDKNETQNLDTKQPIDIHDQSKQETEEMREEQTKVGGTDVIEIEDSGEEEIPLKRTLEERGDSDQSIEEIQEKGRKIPKINQFQQIEQNQKGNEKMREQSLLENQKKDVEDNAMNLISELDESIEWDRVKQKIIKSLQQNNIIAGNDHFSISITGNPKTKLQKSEAKKAIAAPASEDEVVEDMKMKDLQHHLLNEHKQLIEQAKRQLRKGKLTRMDQIVFNILCRELNHIKSGN